MHLQPFQILEHALELELEESNGVLSSFPLVSIFMISIQPDTTYLSLRHRLWIVQEGVSTPEYIQGCSSQSFAAGQRCQVGPRYILVCIRQPPAAASIFAGHDVDIVGPDRSVPDHQILRELELELSRESVERHLDQQDARIDF